MLPTYQELMKPVLEAAKNQEVKLSYVTDLLAEQFNLSEDQRTELLPSGRQAAFTNRVGWAKTYLAKAGLLEATRRGHFVITDLGCEALDSGEEVNNHYLKRFDDFNTFTKPKNSDVEKVDDVNAANSDSTPDEVLRAAYKQINDALASDILSRTRKVTPAFFEQLLIELLLAMGYGGSDEGMAHTLGKSGDNGVDGVINQDPLGVDQIYLQAKRYADGNNVGAGEIRDFFGALNLKKAQKGIFITTSEFTSSATQTAKDLGMRIVLINGKELAKLMLRYNIGSRDEDVLHLKRIDEEFFEG
ncbi:restriction endonuclease [Photobacterium indicum]|uniref:Restriction endonuclease n=1 Tax=Photobacterium indicum TaxID=81447 RepID=A0A2T3L5A3_9GAMM|nr:restriction endonuclease [Photobacterium indicum]PSV44878.1 restriction endonuclease [Photobacterium indicum]